MHIIHMSYHGPVLAVLNAALAEVAQERLRAIYPKERVWAEIAQGPELKDLEVAVVLDDLEIVQAHRMDWTEIDGQYRHKSVRETLRVLMGRYVVGNARGRRTEAESWEAARDLVLASRSSNIYLTGQSVEEMMRSE
jgi:hypothetical protein